ncbi:MAG: ORF6N domain-containing protein [Lachnospiraceae bacterium]|nr:ORF6N domain-containing protein [Lachnospiraceae bacterium]
MQSLQVIEAQGVRVLTTKQIAEAYEVTKDKIIYNFNYNKERFIIGKHYIEVTGDELRRLKTTCENQISFKYAKSLYLWTEKGALLHAKSLNTDKAWEVYDYLVDFYFRAKEKAPEIQQPEPQTYREKREAALAEMRKKEKVISSVPSIQSSYDIAPAFRELISLLPLEALDEMEKCFRGNRSKTVKLAATSILAEKMKRQLA